MHNIARVYAERRLYDATLVRFPTPRIAKMDHTIIPNINAVMVIPDAT